MIIKPRVSICIPTYKQTEYLKKTLDSIKIQTFKDFEIVITDDSPDNSVKELVNTYDFDVNLRYIKNKIPKGSPANWNEAIRQSTGEYIKIMHHDDWFTDETSLHKFVELLDNNPNADFAFSGCLNFIHEKKSHHFVNSDNIQKLREDPYILLLGNIIGAPSVTIYRNNASSAYDESIKWLVDLDFYIRLIIKNQNFTFTEEPLVSICTKGDHQVTKECVDNKNIEIPEYIYVYQKLINQRGVLNKEHQTNILNLLFKYRIIKISELENLPLISKIPDQIRALFSWRQKLSMEIKIVKHIIRSFFARNKNHGKFRSLFKSFRLKKR